jgi:hypothetical protein
MPSVTLRVSVVPRRLHSSPARRSKGSSIPERCVTREPFSPFPAGRRCRPRRWDLWDPRGSGCERRGRSGRIEMKAERGLAKQARSADPGALGIKTT